MRRARPGTKLPPMDAKRINLSLELELDQGRLSGRAGYEAGELRTFSGWLGLIGAIDALLGEDTLASNAPSNTPSNRTETSNAR